ncbi:hypothetical protein [Luteimonas galliterrae]|nr:hypothetical protein [Luteimonas galliterrae]
MLALLGALSLVVSEMPRAWAWPLAAAALAYGGAKARHEARKPAQAWFWPGDGRPATADGVAARDVAVAWRGPLAFVRWRDAAGRWRRQSWWPDTLPAARRRELRLAAASVRASRSAASMAP